MPPERISPGPEQNAPKLGVQECYLRLFDTQLRSVLGQVKIFPRLEIARVVRLCPKFLLPFALSGGTVAPPAAGDHFAMIASEEGSMI